MDGEMGVGGGCCHQLTREETLFHSLFNDSDKSRNGVERERKRHNGRL